ncbi:hypothetical protein DMA11_19870 [Marinilabiliaceae bacterium JC017]|nr:hypothetical protein DMA11_19870 [Marinilabiliaceae bacterium JC017]
MNINHINIGQRKFLLAQGFLVYLKKMLVMKRSLSKRTLEIPSFGTIDLNIENSVRDYEDFFLMAVRKNNTKRNFLFVSQLLGKHIPILPNMLFDSCYKLAADYAAENNLLKGEGGQFICKEKTLVIGFAETATAMGHGVYDCFSGDCFYVHSTRDSISDYEFAFEFEEEHCHASEQLFFLQNESWIKEAKEIILVDDEVTTGKTIRNIIEQIEKRFPGKSYSVITFLDWRNNESLEAYEAFSDRNNISIEFYSLLKGNIESISLIDNTIKEDAVIDPENYNPKSNGWKFHYCHIDSASLTSAGKGIDTTGRAEFISTIDIVVEKVSPQLTGEKRAIIGTGEFMYIPMQCARRFPGVNYCNATTRSPIIPYEHSGYGIRKAFHFICPNDPCRTEYLYNSNVLACDEVVLFLENAVPLKALNSLLSELDSANYSSKHVVFIKGSECD